MVGRRVFLFWKLIQSGAGDADLNIVGLAPPSSSLLLSSLELNDAQVYAP